MHFHRIYTICPLAAAIFGACSASAQTVSDKADPENLVPAVATFNPDLSAIVDAYAYTDDAGHGGFQHLLGELTGFGHSHGGEEDHGHDHGGAEKGFNLRHLELQFAAAVDPYFNAEAIAAIDTEDAEMETASIETTCLPGGFKLKGGKFLSGFGRINEQHSHSWDFTDRPLVYELLLGAHGLNDKGLQLSWLAPTPFYLLAGAEVFQGENENSFAHVGEDPLPERKGPRLGVGWLKVGPNLPGGHALQFGVTAMSGRHQEEHDGDGDGESDHWLDGDSTCWGADAVYKFDSPQPLGEGDFLLQGEYFARRKDLDVVAHDLRPEFIGNRRLDEQDGYYLQAMYGVWPRWRAGLRWEQIGLTNDTELPSGATSGGDRSDRVGVMVDFSPSEFSRLRLQANRGRYGTEDSMEDVTQFFAQWAISLGAHGAHAF